MELGIDFKTEDINKGLSTWCCDKGWKWLGDVLEKCFVNLELLRIAIFCGLKVACGILNVFRLDDDHIMVITVKLTGWWLMNGLQV